MEPTRTAARDHARRHALATLWDRHRARTIIAGCGLGVAVLGLAVGSFLPLGARGGTVFLIATIPVFVCIGTSLASAIMSLDAAQDPRAVLRRLRDIRRQLGTLGAIAAAILTVILSGAQSDPAMIFAAAMCFWLATAAGSFLLDPLRHALEDEHEPADASADD